MKTWGMRLLRSSIVKVSTELYAQLSSTALLCWIQLKGIISSSDFRPNRTNVKTNRFVKVNTQLIINIQSIHIDIVSCLGM